jgi:hypothetical protein
MTKQIDELMALVVEYGVYPSDVLHQAVQVALEAALKPGVEPIGYRYKYKNCFGNIVWSFELPRSSDTKVLETVPVFAAPQAQTDHIVDANKKVPPRLTDAELEEITGEDIASSYSGHVETWRAIETAVRKQFGVNDE